jgi:glycosyltransferase involved in cell wall biosynthesis
MKVLQLTTQMLSASRIALPLAHYLREVGHDVTLASSWEEHPDAPACHESIEEAGFAFLQVPIPRAVNLIADFRALRILVRILREGTYDLVHTHNSKAGVLGRLAARIAGVPYVVHTDHGLPFFKADLFSVTESLAFWLTELVCAPLADRILTVSEAEYDKVKRCFIARPPKLVNVGHGVDATFYSRVAAAKGASFRRVHELRESIDGCRVVGCVARLVAGKGIDCLLDAASICLQVRRDIVFLIVGDGMQRAAMERRAAELALCDNVHFLGFIADPEEVRELYSLMDVFVLPTHSESFGVAFVQAMSMEVPPIGPRIAPITSLIEHGKSGLLVEPEDSHGYARAILELIDQPDRRRAMGQAGRRAVIDKWSRRAACERVERVYKELVFNRQRRKRLP